MSIDLQKMYENGTIVIPKDIRDEYDTDLFSPVATDDGILLRPANAKILDEDHL